MQSDPRRFNQTQRAFRIALNSPAASAAAADPAAQGSDSSGSLALVLHLVGCEPPTAQQLALLTQQPTTSTSHACATALAMVMLAKRVRAISRDTIFGIASHDPSGMLDEFMELWRRVRSASNPTAIG